jgi:hypothetical protein
MIELLPKLFTDAQISALAAEDDFTTDDVNFLIKVPGGKGLYDRIKAAM